MAHHKLEADYLIVGTGAVGMAFADTMLMENKDATIIMVDRHHMPGGHWNDAYSFVNLHQPSAFYGVSSKPLGTGLKDEVGLNKGLMELASGAEVSAYFDQVMKHTFLPSGRVQYFPMCDYEGDGKFRGISSGDTYEVDVKKKVVDATYFKTSVPATHTPSYTIDDGLIRVPLNALPNIHDIPSSYVIVGGGKTGIDAILWLLEKGVDPDLIKWIMPRDAWLHPRENTQPAAEFFKASIGAQARQMECIANADSIDDLFARLEEAGCLVRIDQSVKPEMYHGATISIPEMEQLRRVKNVIRLGRVKHITENEIQFEKGRLPTDKDALYVDCSARAVPVTEQYPVFDGNLITIQTVRTIQPVFSGSLVAYVEAHYDSERQKNDICTVVPLPNHDTDWIICQAGMMMNQMRWSQEKEMRSWIKDNRLDGFTRLVADADTSDPENMEILMTMKNNGAPAMMKLQQFIGEITSSGPKYPH